MPPIASPSASSPPFARPGIASVAATAIAIPSAATRLPERAVAGALRRFKPRMNSTAAAR